LDDDFCRAARLAFVPNPNSPTGTIMPPDRMEQLQKKGDGLLVVDEAYVDFADHHCMKLVRRLDRLVVLRTLSKSYALAGLRFGFAVCSPDVAEMLRRVKDSYNCDALSIAGAVAAIRDQEYLQQTVTKIKATRSRTEQELSALGFRVTPSSANFVWFQSDRPLRPVFEALAERKILIRYFDYPTVGEGLRVSIGTDAEIDSFLTALREVAHS
jgi:histidinol-phosphate aminotransferase